jgi:3-hydroxyacyl-CoA dehydrogenase/enoyl-CoA hydratase/3-hydroxybutyryl-CoA epimerase
VPEGAEDREVDMDAAMRNWSLEIDGENVATLTLDCAGASANTLGREVMTELDACLGEVEQRRPVALVLRSGKASGFVAGADIREFTSLSGAEEAYALVRAGQQVLDRLEGLPCPTVAAIHGFALGGGLELALACRYRVGDRDTVAVGLPEVMLGIHPGFGGTVRAPRLIGAPAALDLMLTGKTVRGDKVLKMGLVDRLVPRSELEAEARRIALAPPAPHRPPLPARLLAWPGLRQLVARPARLQVARKARREHYPAPYAIIDLWSAHGARGPAAYEAEARSISRLFLTSTSRNLVRLFFLQNRLKSLGGKAGGDFARVHVVGAGVMGGDIAAWCAYRGMRVTLEDREQRLIDPALARAAEFFARRCRRPGQAEDCAARLVADVRGEGVTDADIVIEAIFENAEAKRGLYARIEPRLKPGALLATNTSSIVLEDLAGGLTDPSRLVGLHFFNPVARMMLVEVIRGRETREDVLEAAMAFTRRLDKLPLPCRSSPGFAVNRVLMPYMAEAMYAVEEGIPLEVIDKAATDFGMPMGPVELADTVGLDVAMNVGRILAEAYGREAPTGVVKLVEAGRLGRKTGQGYYTWREGKPVRERAAGVAPEDLQDRLVLQYLNEAVACLREGVVADADLLDAGMVFGTGFAPFRGGPIRYARERGIGEIVARLGQLEEAHGLRFRPDAGWQTLDTLRS